MDSSARHADLLLNAENAVNMRTVAKLVFFLAVAVATLEIGARIDDAVRYGAPLFASYTMDDIFEFREGGKCGRPYGRYQK